MVSTYLSYRLYTADLAKSTARTLSNVQVSREASYYRDNIGKITSVDAFLKDQRLYAYAMKAYGLEDMTYAKAFMRKVLESDLTAKDSFVNKLVDQRYKTFANAFNFTSEGGVELGDITAQDAADAAETVSLYSQQRILKGASAATEVDYYKSKFATLTSVDDLVGDAKLFSVALKAFGIDPDIASESAIRSVLVSDLSDPTSPANAFNDQRYVKLRSAFSFAADGSATAGGAQTAAKLISTIDAYYDKTGNGSSPAAAAFRTEAFKSLMASVTTVDDFANNEILRSYALTSVGLDPILVGPTTVRDALTSDLTDPDSEANKLGVAYRTLAAAFSFKADGSLEPGEPAQTPAQEATLTDFYMMNYGMKALTAEETQTNYYKLKTATALSVSDILNDSKLFNYVVKAYGLDPDEESKSKIRQVILSDPKDSTSYARRLRDDRYTALAGAFNFGSDGEARGIVQAQIDSARSATITRYTITLGTLETDQARGKVESEYYASTIENIGSVDALLKDKRLVTYMTRAFGFTDETLTNDFLKQVLTSDLYDPKSFVNKAENYRFRELAAAFNFATDGTARRFAGGTAQDDTYVLQTQDAYIRQTMEEQAGDQNEGVRLALYFQRKASSITSAYSILADKALLEVVMTALALPDAVAQSDTDKLAQMLEKRLTMADFKDPAKVEKFLARYAALYDIDNPQSQQSITSMLLSGDTSSVFGQDMLTSINSLKLNL
jgi:hypothetical protein